MVLDPTIIERIRAIFLHDEDRVTIDEAASVLGLTRAEMNAAVKNGDIELIDTRSGKMVALRELAGQALQRRPLTVIEVALGRDAALVMPPKLRTRNLTVRHSALSDQRVEGPRR